MSAEQKADCCRQSACSHTQQDFRRRKCSICWQTLHAAEEMLVCSHGRGKSAGRLIFVCADKKPSASPREAERSFCVREFKILTRGSIVDLNMSSENESNDNCDDSQVEGQEGNSSARAEVSSQKRTECLISLVEKYRLLYDLEDSSHKDKWKIANAWTEIASGTGESVTWCKNKWKITRDYYYKLKSGNKGKSGQKRGKAITWAFFNMMSFLDGVKNSNENTTSNLDFVGPAKVPRTDDLTSNSSDGQNEHNPEASPPSTRVENGTPKSSLPIKKRSLNSQDELNMKMMEYLDKSSQALISQAEEPADEITCWGRLAMSRLRQLHPSHATDTMMQCDQVIVTAVQGSHSFMQRLQTYDHEPNDYDYRQQ